MKNKPIAVLFLATALFIGLVAGLFLGRNCSGDPVSVSPLPVPAETHAAAAVADPSESTESVFPIDINTADVQTLTALPGIGAVLAERIVRYREQNGPFTHVEQLKNIEDIGQTRLEAIADLITIGG